MGVSSWSPPDHTQFGILSSRIHSLWARGHGNRLGAGNQSRYNAPLTYQTYPFPAGLNPDIPAASYQDDLRATAISSTAKRLTDLREAWLNPADLVVSQAEVVPELPSRWVAKDAAAAKELSRRTLTNLYNDRPEWLAATHTALDLAVADAYGWGADWGSDGLNNDEVLARLFKLNMQRAPKPRR